MLSYLLLMVGIAQDRVPVPLPPPPPVVEHHYNPGVRTVHTTYTCMDGYRSITLQEDERGRRQITSMSRNGQLARVSTVDGVNAILAERFTAVSGIHPQCGSRDDLMLISGRRGRAHAAIAIGWTPESAEFAYPIE